MQTLNEYEFELFGVPVVIHAPTPLDARNHYRSMVLDKLKESKGNPLPDGKYLQTETEMFHATTN